MSFFAAHRDLLERAVAACRARTYWSAYPESASGKIYGETAKADGEAAFKAMLGKPFELDQPSDKRASKETSPYGMALGITYPTAAAATLIAASQRAGRGWARLSFRRMSSPRCPPSREDIVVGIKWPRKPDLRREDWSG